MATLEQKQKLIDVLKFTPRTYKIQLWGYGGEKVMGTVDRKSWDYCLQHQIDLQDIAWDGDAAENWNIDADQLPFPPGSWYECDDLAHVNGVNRNAGTLQIEDENGDTVCQHELEDLDTVDWECGDEVWIGGQEPGTVVFVGTSNEKGVFFEGNIELTQPFDIAKLTLRYEEVDGEEIVNSVSYDGEDINNWGGSTNGKSSDFVMCLVKEHGEWDRYEPVEKDWGHPPMGVSPSGWESSPKFKFKNHKPTIPGYYSVNWSNGSSYGSLYWNGTEFGEWEYGKFTPVRQEGVKTWSGYNWDTTSWVNQPPEPVDVICDNKKCAWTGHSHERREDDDYNDHCPVCDGTSFTWIDYDANTKQGRANRAKYCREWDPEIAMDRIVKPLPDSQ